MEENYFIGVDVGTGSVRAALVKQKGEIVKVASHPIETWNLQRDHYEQSSDNIWKACCKAVQVVSNSVNRELIKGIGFDATCSLVCIGENNEPLTVSVTGNNEQNIILWMDHRAKSQAEFINHHSPKVLNYVGGKISLEMQTPKLMWIKQNLGETWRKAKYFFDLGDFLTWKATGDDSRSLCTVVCKWTYIAGEPETEGWDSDYFSLIGLEDLLNNDSVKIGSRVKAPGEKCGLGLTKKAAEELGLLPGTFVGAALIDAHAGGLGLLTASAPEIRHSFETKLCMISGTSTCHMVVNQNPKLVSGVWGPYYSAMVPFMYLNEAGQSATGKLIDFVIDTHPATPKLKKKFQSEESIFEFLNDVLNQMAKSKNLESISRLSSRLHVWPDYHGNRSPIADPTLLGMISGLSLAADEEDLAVKYLATMQALAYGTRHILETLRCQGYENLCMVLMCGGLSKNPLFVQTHADVLDLPVVIPRASEPVLLGAAILGAVAAGEFEDVKEALEMMKGPSDIFLPNRTDLEYHSRKYQVFLKMVEDQRLYDEIMVN